MTNGNSEPYKGQTFVDLFGDKLNYSNNEIEEIHQAIRDHEEALRQNEREHQSRVAKWFERNWPNRRCRRDQVESVAIKRKPEQDIVKWKEEGF